MPRIKRDKQTLLARKEELLKELKYYEKRIDDARSKTNSSFYDESSDSEQEFTVELEPSISELKLKQSMLQTCLFATQELTGVQILQSEVNVMVNEPVFEKESPVKEAGVWKEVTAECRIDLVPFSMTFYVHHPKRLFGPPQYRCLQVTPVKTAHETELAQSVLPTLKTPSDAVEVVRHYARAHRSRRSTLARLAERYANELFMEPLPEGGYVLKCANLLEVSWTLINKRSPITPFHHRLKFDLEYMDETYVKIITQAHRQLSDPAVETDERTLLLAKIINTCLQARKDMPVTESESDTDRVTDQNAETGAKDSEIMAPPKTIPKKVKPNKKRSIEDGGGISKKAKIDNKENFYENNKGKDENLISMIEKNDLKSKNNDIRISDKVQIKKTINEKKDGTKESIGHKNSNVKANIFSKSNSSDSKRTEAKVGNTDSKKKEDENNKDVNNEKVTKKSKVNSKTDNKEAKEIKSATGNDKNSNDKTSGAKIENKNSVASSKNEKDNMKSKMAKSKKVTTEPENAISKNNKNDLKEKNVGNNIENNKMTKDVNSKSDGKNSKNNKDSLKNKNIINKNGKKEIVDNIISNSGSVTSKNDKNYLNSKDVNNKVDNNVITNETSSISKNSKNTKDDLKNKTTKSNKETNSKPEISKNDDNNLKNKNVINKKDINEITDKAYSKSDNKSSKNDKDNLKNTNVGSKKGTKQITTDINSKSENKITKDVENNLNSIEKEDITRISKNKNPTKSDAKSANVNNVVITKNRDKLKPINTKKTKANPNETFTKTDKNDENKKENVNGEIKKKSSEKRNFNTENVIASKKSKTELKNDKNFEKIQKISTNLDINKKNISNNSNIKEVKSQNLMQRFSKSSSVANKPNVASSKKIISPNIMKNKNNVKTKISVMKNILSASKQSDKNSSKIPQRIKSSDVKKNILRLSPRFIKKPSVKPKM